jgi:uncharacterized protein (DUF924 family)
MEATVTRWNIAFSMPRERAPEPPGNATLRPAFYPPVPCIFVTHERQASRSCDSSVSPMTEPHNAETLSEYESVLSFWFGTLDDNGAADREHTQRWWKKDAAFDELVRGFFGPLHAEVALGRRDYWLTSTRGRLAMVIVLDQFSRNMFRGSALSFAHDERALAVAFEGIDRHIDTELVRDLRSFLYMPLMHSEDPVIQDRSVDVFTRFRDELPEPGRTALSGSVEFAKRHRDIVRRFGRFPHRNTILGRVSTPEEVEFLKEDGSSF